MSTHPFLGGRYKARITVHPHQTVDESERLTASKAEYHNYERNLRDAERAHDQSKELRVKLVEAAARDATEAIKVALAINGGASIAILAFLGSLGSRSTVTLSQLQAVASSLYWFAGGVLAAGMAAGCAYFANSYYAAAHAAETKGWEYPYVNANEHSKRFWRRAKLWNWAGVLLAGSTLIEFPIGLYVAARGLAQLAR